MPAKDLYHDTVKNALIADGWTITHDPYKLQSGMGKVYVDLGAELPIAAERGGERIAVEIKSFLGESDLYEFERALGQYVYYRLLLGLEEPDRRLFLAVPLWAYEETLQKKVTPPVLEKLALSLIVYDPDEERIIRWIP